MNCEESKNLMTVSVYGKLTLSEKAELEEHLRECQKCARIYERSAQFSPQFDKKKDIPLPDKEKSWQIISTKAFQRKRGWKVFFPYKKLALAASALVVVFILGFIVGKQFFFPGSGEIQPESTALRGYDSPIREKGYQRYTGSNPALEISGFTKRRPISSAAYRRCGVYHDWNVQSQASGSRLCGTVNTSYPGE
jgi:hypothetical protein